jgi:hypothetical protein
MTLPLIVLFVSCTVAAFWLARYEQAPLTNGRIVRLVLAVVALALFSVVGLRGPLPVNVIYLVATGLLALMLAGVVVMDRRFQRR